MTAGAGIVSGAPPKLLFDQNLSPRLARVLASLYPGSAHVRDVGLAEADDEVIWVHAATYGYVIVTKDDDFRQRSFVRGHRLKSSGLGWATAGQLMSNRRSVRGIPR